MKLSPLLALVLAAVLFSPAVSVAAGPPQWLRQAARTAAAHLSDGTVPTKTFYLGPHSRFPRVVLTGSFVLDALDAAFSALDDRLKGIPGDPDPFSHRPGTFTCHIHYPVREMRYVAGSCTTAVRLQAARAAVATFVERWRPREYEHGRWVRLPTRTHTWRIVETHDGWQTRISSSGDQPPQLPAGVNR